jgi:hypothetical protein
MVKNNSWRLCRNLYYKILGAAVLSDEYHLLFYATQQTCFEDVCDFRARSKDTAGAFFQYFRAGELLRWLHPLAAITGSACLVVDTGNNW